MMGIRDWPAAERPREKLLALGAQALSEAELLALLLGGAGRNGLDAVSRARELLARHGTLRGLLSALSAPALCAPRPRARFEPGLGLVGYCRVQASLELARRHYAEAMRAGPALDSPTTTQWFLRARLRDSPHELFCCLHLDNRHRLIAFDELFRGTIDGASVHPREVVKQALARNAAAVILAHNHPLCCAASVTTGFPVAHRQARHGFCARLQLPLPGLGGDPAGLFGVVAPGPEPADQLWIRGEADELRPATPNEVIAAARRAMSRRIHRGVAMDSPRAVREFLAMKLGTLEHELFVVLLLDNRHRLIDYVELFRGTIDGASVHPREVVKLALARNAAALVLAHPHPSGVAEASQADRLITQRLREALALVDIRVLDHVIIAGGEAVSFAERGLL